MLTVEVNTDGRRRSRHKTAALSMETAGMLLRGAEAFLPTTVWKLYLFCHLYLFFVHRMQLLKKRTFLLIMLSAFLSLVFADLYST